MQNFILHWKLHWFKYISIIILSLIFVGSYFEFHISEAAGVVPVKTGQIGGEGLSIGSGVYGIGYPQSIVFDSNGNMFISGDGSMVFKYDNTGSLVLVFGGKGTGDGKFGYSERMAVDSQNNIYITDGGNNRVQKFDNNGNFLSSFGTYGNGNGQFNYPYGIAVATSGEIYVAENGNHRIQKFDSNGNFISKFGTQGSGNGQFNYPYGIAVATSGEIYVADAYNNRIQKFDSNGNFLLKFGTYGSGDGQFSGTMGVAFNMSGDIYVTDSANHRIQKFDSNGNFISKFGTQGIGSNQFFYPASINIDFNNNIYISELYNSRISIYSIPPFIFSSSTSSTTNSVTSFSWNTSREANGRVEYGPSTNYGTSTEIVNNSPKTTTHTVSVTGLPTCTVINYRLISVDEDGSTATSSNYTTNTGGCVNMAPVISSVAVVASSTATSTVTNSTITLTVPPSVSATSSNIVFQANTIEPTVFYQTASVPSGKTAVKSEVFHLVAIDTVTTDKVSTFQAPIAVSISYSPEDLNGIDPNTLTIYRYDGSVWYPLSNCSTDTNAHTVTCYTTNFSDFALFAVPKPAGGAAYYYQRGDIDSPATIQRVEALRASTSNTVAINTNPVSAAINSLNKTSLLITSTLYYGLFSNEVSLLQSYLATLPGIYPEALVTGYYGKLTQKAVQRYQCKYNIVCEGSPKGTGWGVVGKRTRDLLQIAQ